MARPVHRRAFLQHTAALTAAAVGVHAVPLVSGEPQKLRLAVVGVAHRGGANLNGVADEQIVALCDIDETLLGKAAERFPKAQTFFDFRTMLDKVHRQIDAIVVSTPDHTHAAPAAMAMRLGKHCYCEKPLTHEVFETRVLRQLARQNNLVTQLGTQIHAGDNYRRVVELVQSGAIGAIREVHVWSAASYGSGLSRPTETPPVPSNIHWDQWIGPAPFRPYHPTYLPGKWRGWWDFGSGGLGDFGCHYMDLPFWALKLREPLSIEAEGPPVDKEATNPWTIVRYEFPARGELPPVNLTWYDGGKRPEAQLAESDLLPEKSGKKEDAGKALRSGVLFVGAKGRIFADYTRHRLLPVKTFEGFQPPEPTIPKSLGHHREWIEACKSGGPTTCNFDYSGALSEAVLLGCVSYRVGSKLVWDAQQLKATNCPAADQYIRRPYREGWKL